MTSDPKSVPGRDGVVRSGRGVTRRTVLVALALSCTLTANASLPGRRPHRSVLVSVQPQDFKANTQMALHAVDRSFVEPISLELSDRRTRGFAFLRFEFAGLDREQQTVRVTLQLLDADGKVVFQATKSSKDAAVEARQAVKRNPNMAMQTVNMPIFRLTVDQLRNARSAELLFEKL